MSSDPWLVRSAELFGHPWRICQLLFDRRELLTDQFSQTPGGLSGVWGGYLLAAVAALCWALYSLACQVPGWRLGERIPHLLLTASGITGIASLGLEGVSELPSLTALLATAVLGLGPYGIAMQAWDRAMATRGRIGWETWPTPSRCWPPYSSCWPESLRRTGAEPGTLALAAGNRCHGNCFVITALPADFSRM